MVAVSTGRQILPPEEALFTAQAATGRAMAALYDAVNNDLGFEALRLTNHQIQMGDWTTGDNGRALTITTPHYVRFTPGPLAQYLFVSLLYAAGDGPSAAPAIDLSLETAAGVVEDAGYTLSEAAGTLDFTDERQVFGTAVYMVTAAAGIARLVNSGWTHDDTLVGRRKRTLDVGARQGQDLVIKLELTDVRVYSVAVLEAFRREV